MLKNKEISETGYETHMMFWQLKLKSETVSPEATV